MILFFVFTDQITIFHQSSQFIQIAINNGIKMQLNINSVRQLYITLPDDAKGTVRGMITI